jgi:hypothetical protein
VAASKASSIVRAGGARRMAAEQAERSICSK